LTPEQKARLDKLRSEIRLDRVTVSFSLDEYHNGRKKGAFRSLTSFRSNEEGGAAGWNLAELRIIEAMLCKQVVASVYGDAIRMKILERDEASREATSILEAYDRHLLRLMADERKPT
jgi:hypothetical protein